MLKPDVALSDWMPRAALVVLAVTAMRLALMAFNRTDLFVDEAQYWFWGQDLAFGYYSKPPLIGWVIRASTELAGSNLPFWVRLPAPLLHAVTALLIGGLAARLSGAQAAVWTAALYVTLPMVTVGSYMISTDTVMYPCLVLALWFWLTALERGGAIGWAAAAGACLGLAFLAKYAALYFMLCAPLAALLTWRGRAPPATWVAALVSFAIVISPNVAWNLLNGLTTVQHTMDNADWVRDPSARTEWNVAGLAAFFGSQFAVFGPVLFGALLWLGVRRGANDPTRAFLLIYSFPILAIVCVQALLSEAYANWAVAAYIGGLLAVVPWLLGKPRVWLIGTLALHLAIAVLIPFATAFGTQWRVGPEDRLLLERYLGRSDMSRAILTEAAEFDLPIVADHRHILADLFYTGRNTDIVIMAEPERGFPSNHYVQVHAIPPAFEGDVLFATFSRVPEACSAATHIREITPAQGAYRGRTLRMWRVAAGCLRP